MEEYTPNKSILLPQTKLGTFAFWLGIVVLALVLFLFINTKLAEPLGENLIGFFVFLGIATAIAALITGLIAIIKHKERSITVFLMSAIGLATFIAVVVAAIKSLMK